MTSFFLFFFLFFVTASPTFSKAPPPVLEALVGSHLSLACAAHGNPSPTITWLKDGKVIEGTSTRVGFNLFSSIYSSQLNLNIPSKDTKVLLIQLEINSWQISVAVYIQIACLNVVRTYLTNHNQ